MAISNVVKNGQYYELYDALGKKSKSIHSNTIGDLMGFGSVFFVTKKEVLMNFMMI